MNRSDRYAEWRIRKECSIVATACQDR
ncbi:hypothetical protein BN381_80010 [Candidatus Microthrix parvicella RN1]|uniref:Uncharacterized protein n=1 Tax=Candidatus Neomicrothrix parvicella RN1 TaxID=1229780 RepID=R4Z467_9ACTN|nr:hypothetical protein BN381_80010 [Candidatus Microthrix parvicella RN1]